MAYLGNSSTIETDISPEMLFAFQWLSVVRKTGSMPDGSRKELVLERNLESSFDSNEDLFDRKSDDVRFGLGVTTAVKPTDTCDVGSGWKGGRIVPSRALFVNKRCYESPVVLKVCAVKVHASAGLSDSQSSLAKFNRIKSAACQNQR